MSKETLISKEKYDFSDLCELIDILRAPDGCPWDREQNHKSIRKGLIEETYEVVEGIDKSDDKIMCEELGDLLMQVVFHASIARDENAFDLNDICTGICKKLIYRHPHVFADVSVENSAQVLKNWDELKKAEKGQRSKSDVLNSVSRALPSMMRAQKLSKKSGEQTSIESVCDSIADAAMQFKTGAAEDDGALLGQLLFDAARLGNLKSVDLEQALYDENEQFCRNYLLKD